MPHICLVVGCQANPIVLRKQFRGTDIRLPLMRLDHQLGDRCRIAQAEIQALRADRRDDVRGFL